MPANATNCLGLSNRSISPISEIIVAAIFSPIPGIDWMILYSSISFARYLSLLPILIDALYIAEYVNIYTHTQ
jgi:general stress protein CsbA